MNNYPESEYRPLNFDAIYRVLNWGQAVFNNQKFGFLDQKIHRDITLSLVACEYEHFPFNFKGQLPIKAKLEFTYTINGEKRYFSTMLPWTQCVKIFEEFDKADPSEETKHLIRTVLIKIFQGYISNTMGDWISYK